MIKKSKMFSMKVSPIELDAWRTLAENYGITLSRLIRLRLAGTQPAEKPAIRHRPPPQVDEKFIFIVSGIENTMSRIARRCSTDDHIAVLVELVNIENDLSELISLAKKGELQCT